MTASELKIGDVFKKCGHSFTVRHITQDTYKNGRPNIIVSCTMNNSNIIDSFFHFKPTTKIK